MGPACDFKVAPVRKRPQRVRKRLVKMSGVEKRDRKERVDVRRKEREWQEESRDVREEVVINDSNRIREDIKKKT